MSVVTKAKVMFFRDHKLTQIQCDLLVTGIYLSPQLFFVFLTECILGWMNRSEEPQVPLQGVWGWVCHCEPP